ncbi:sce7726 family protein [Asticcacaulis sp.]|uniref:sce7726 family protein n=1 Tax=Asticcacaulis sp. TaxID=1872648 RepID=UPI0031D693CD
MWHENCLPNSIHAAPWQIQKHDFDTPVKLDETSIKSLLLQKFRAAKRLNTKSIIASEWVLGRTGNRADLAIWNGKLIGVEIKSKFDSLERLENQIQNYKKCFDEVVVVLAEKHLEHGISLIGEGVELWSIDNNAELKIKLAQTRPSEPDPKTLVSFLSQSQLKDVTRHLTESGGYSDRRKVATSLPINQLRQTVAESFKKSFQSTTEAFWEEVGRGKIQPSHIRKLSRFQSRRDAWNQAQIFEHELWQNWKSVVCSEFDQVAIAPTAG